jgi:hypothetical protein
MKGKSLRLKIFACCLMLALETCRDLFARPPKTFESHRQKIEQPTLTQPLFYAQAAAKEVRAAISG